MSYTLVYTDSYNKKATRFLKKHPSLVSKYAKTLELLALNPAHPSLRLHKLEGRLNELYSVSINLQYRIVLYVIVVDKQIIPVSVGDHAAVY